MTEKVCYLVEEFSQDVPRVGSTIIALTPKACFQLKQAGINYTIAEEFFPKEAPYKDSDAYFFDQISWIREFDAFLKRNIVYCREKNIDFAKAHYARLKYWSDTVIVGSKILKRIIEVNKPTRIVYVSNFSAPVINGSIYDLFSAPQSIFFQLIGFISKALGDVPVSFIQVKSNASSSNTLGINVRFALKKIAVKLYGKQLFNFFRFKKYLKIKNVVSPKNPLRVLVMHTGSQSIDYVVTQLISIGAQVFNFYYLQGLLVKESSFFSKSVMTINCNEGYKEQLQSDFARAAERLSKDNSLIAWFAKRSGVDIREYIVTVLRDFMTNTCLKDIPYIEKLTHFLTRESIDMVIMRGSTGRDAIVALIAADKTKRCKKICFQHFCTAVDSRYAQMIELGFFDYYITSEGLSEEYFKTKSDIDIFRNCTVYQSPHYLKSLPRQTRKDIHRGKERIIFAPTDTLIGIYNINNEFMTGARYYRFLKTLIDYFAKRNDKIFIFKYILNGTWAETSIVAYIKSLKVKNILLENKPLIKCFDMADRVVLDHPATGFFEALASGLPTMSLYESFMMMWEKDVKFFGKTLQSFSSSEEAIQRIGRFLDADADDYRVDVSMKDINVVELLNSMVVKV